jgi:tetratricopeptide (TPR) repeat protein
VTELYKSGKKLYAAGDYVRAYDEFSKAYEITGDPALLWNRAQALRHAGGRRAEAIGLFEQLLKTDISEDRKAAVRVDLEELRGPARSADEKANKTLAGESFEKARELYKNEKYAQAYDEFTRAWELTGDRAYLFNRAQSRRLEGGRRTEAIALYEQLLNTDISDEQKKAVRAYIDELRGVAKAAEAGSGASPV